MTFRSSLIALGLAALATLSHASDRSTDPCLGFIPMPTVDHALAAQMSQSAELKRSRSSDRFRWVRDEVIDGRLFSHLVDQRNGAPILLARDHTGRVIGLTSPAGAPLAAASSTSMIASR